MQSTKKQEIKVPPLNFSQQLLQNRKFRRSGVNDGSRPSSDRALTHSASDPSLNLSYISIKRLNPETQKQPSKNDPFTSSLSNLRKKFLRSVETGATYRAQVDQSGEDSYKQLTQQIKILKKQNTELKQKISALSPQRPTNKFRQNTTKQRIKQLQKENIDLKGQIIILKKQNHELKGSKIFSSYPEDTASSISLERESFISYKSECLPQFNQKEQLENLERQIKNLNDIISRQQLQIDFLNRKAYSQNQQVKNTFEGVLKGYKDRLNQSFKENNSLKKKIYEFKLEARCLNEEIETMKKFEIGSPGRDLHPSQQRIFKMNRTDTLLSLSSQGDYPDD